MAGPLCDFVVSEEFTDGPSLTTTGPSVRPRSRVLLHVINFDTAAVDGTPFEDELCFTSPSHRISQFKIHPICYESRSNRFGDLGCPYPR